MRCPHCTAEETRVLESRHASDGTAVRRRRECQACGRRFTTFERHERGSLYVRKRDGGREPFDRDKLLGGLLRAAHKRPVEPGGVEAVVERIASEVEAGGGELDAARIGELALLGLRELDPVAYVRFASVYRDFGDVAEFEAELAHLAVQPPLAAGGSVRPQEDASELRAESVETVVIEERA